MFVAPTRTDWHDRAPVRKRNSFHAGPVRSIPFRVRLWDFKWDRHPKRSQKIQYINVLYGKFGGWGGIRTHEERRLLPVFKTGPFDRSGTHPSERNQ